MFIEIMNIGRGKYLFMVQILFFYYHLFKKTCNLIGNTLYSFIGMTVYTHLW